MQIRCSSKQKKPYDKEFKLNSLFTYISSKLACDLAHLGTKQSPAKMSKIPTEDEGNVLPSQVLPPLLRLPSSIRIYIFALAGLGGLLKLDPPLWDMLYFEASFQHKEVSMLHAPKNLWYQWLRKAEQEAYAHPLYSVSKQIRLEARCALLKYNRLELCAHGGMLEWLQTWEPECLKSLRNLMLIPFHEHALGEFAQFIKKNLDLPNLVLCIFDSDRYGPSILESDGGRRM